MTELFPQTGFVDVALPVPLRRLFTYRMPEGVPLEPGMRVAVPFHGRKLPGFVVGLRESPPEGVTRIHSVAGLFEPEPVFPPELLSFLDEAARYYFHPLGEVLRAAAPALPTGAVRALRKKGFLAKDEGFVGRAVKERTVEWVERGDGPLPTRPGPRQREVLDLVEARARLPLEELAMAVKDGRTVVRALVARGTLRLRVESTVALPRFGEAAETVERPVLTDEQLAAVKAITNALESGEGGAFLLHGVTGSGKTEVYLRVLEEALARGRGGLLLVPEIALTPQLVSRVRSRFGDGIAVLHSALSDRERDDAWRALRNGAVRIAVGARSALFAPVPDLGLVLVDEEHDPSFKQEEGFRYHARDMALLRAARAKGVAVLGSATPSLETYARAEEGKLSLLVLQRRATGQSMPEVEIVDLRRHKSTPSGHSLITGPLHQALVHCLETRGQAMLFLNRRGFAPSLRCEACDTVVECPACSVALTEHRAAGILKCHYCDFTAPATTRCLVCGEDALVRVGVGTERLEETLAQIFAPAKVARLDRDTATEQGTESVLARLRRREIDILVGTQMITKGHDVPGVTLVGVILGDQSLAFPDFRASERTFQLLAQVAGRAGRADRPGRVVIQTYQPEHPAIRCAARHDYRGFFENERRDRVELRYPPFTRLVAIRVDAGSESVSERTAGELAALARRHPAVVKGDVEILGPAPAPIARVRGRFRHRLLLRGITMRGLRAVASVLATRIDEGLEPARATLDVDPVSML